MTRSKICPLNGDPADTTAAMTEAEGFANENGLEGKEAMHLRLLSEEVLGLANALTDIKDGTFVIEKDDKEYRIILSADVEPLGPNAKERLLGASSSKENSLYKGFTGKLRMIMDCYISGTDVADAGIVYTSGGLTGYTMSSDWSLYHLRQQMEKDAKKEAWDELESSVLARLADDIQVGIRYEKVVITVIKTIR